MAYQETRRWAVDLVVSAQPAGRLIQPAEIIAQAAILAEFVEPGSTGKTQRPDTSFI